MTRRGLPRSDLRPEARVLPGNGERPPKRADGIELIGEAEDSGFKEAPSLVRRADDQIIQLPPLLYSVVEKADGQRTTAQIAEDLQIPEGTVKSRLHSAVRALRLSIQEKGVTR